MRKTGEAWVYAQNRCGMVIWAKQVRHGYMRKTGAAWVYVYQVRHGYMRKTGEAWLYAQNRCGMGICAKQVRHGYMYVYVESVSCSSVFI